MTQNSLVIGIRRTEYNQRRQEPINEIGLAARHISDVTRERTMKVKGEEEKKEKGKKEEPKKEEPAKSKPGLRVAGPGWSPKK